MSDRRRNQWQAQAIRIILLLIATSWLAVPVEAQATPVAHLTLQSQPGDFIGQGGTFDITYTPTNSTAFFTEIRKTIGPFPGSPAEVGFNLGTVTGGSDNTFVTLFFGTDQLGIPLQPGIYPNAQRADFASPGFA
jgi:hypothetical protein